MKKLLLTICSSLFCVLSYAQTEHLTFKGLPIDGSKQEFVKELQRQGYVYVDDDILSGTFIGRDSYVFIYDTPITNTVWQVGVLFKSTYDTWSLIKRIYDEVFFFADAKTLKLPDDELITELKEDNPEWFN